MLIMLLSLLLPRLRNLRLRAEWSMKMCCHSLSVDISTMNQTTLN